MTSGAFMFNDVLLYTVNSQILKRVTIYNLTA